MTTWRYYLPVKGEIFKEAYKMSHVESNDCEDFYYKAKVSIKFQFSETKWPTDRHCPDLKFFLGPFTKISCNYPISQVGQSKTQVYKITLNL